MPAFRMAAMAAGAGRFRRENVVNLDADTQSILSLYRALIRLRKAMPQLVSGDYLPVEAQGDLLLYRRGDDGEAVIDGAESRRRARIGHDRRDRPWPRNPAVDLARSAGRGIEGVLDLRGNEGVIVGMPDDQAG